MKQANKLLNITNIVTYLFFYILNFFSSVYYEYNTILLGTSFTILAISNIWNATLNIKRKNKKIGIITMIIAAMFIINAIIIICSYEMYIEDVFFYIVCGFTIILAIINLSINIKNQDISVKRYKTLLFILCIILYVLAILIPITITKINMNNFKKAIEILDKQPKEERIIYNSGFNKCKFYDKEGNLKNSYTYTVYSESEYSINSHTAKILIVKENGKYWIVDYNGKKLFRVYNLISNEFNLIYYKYKDSGQNVYFDDLCNTLKISEKLENSYTFGNFEDNNYKILVEINKDEEESDKEFIEKYKLKLKTKYTSWYSYDEESDYVDEIYKYKKNYYLITKDGEKKKLDCNNLIISFDQNDNLEICIYSNGYIPYYDENTNGYFDINGNKIENKNGDFVYDVTDKYEVYYDELIDNFFIRCFKDEKLINLYTNSIRLYNQNVIITDSDLYVIKNNELNKISDGEYVGKYVIINSEEMNESYYRSPYEYIEFVD